MLMYTVSSGYRSLPGTKYYMCFRIAYYYACRLQDLNNELNNGLTAQVTTTIF